MRKLFKIAFLTACISSFGNAQTYDKLNRLTSETYPDGSTVTYIYDKAGNLKQVQVTPAPARDEDGDKMTDAFEQAHAQNNTDLKPNEDEDGDGKTNFHEYAFGLNPSQIDQIQAAGIAESYNDPTDGKTYMQFSYLRRKDSGLTSTPAVSTNLKDWNTGNTHISEVSVTDNGDDSETVVIRYLNPLEAPPRCFFRVLAE